MRPILLQLKSFRSHRDLTVEFPDGCMSITGPNGAGKSSILTAIDVALFGPEGRSLAPYVTDGEDTMRVELQFEHGRDRYRVTRAVDRAKTTVDLAILGGPSDDEWVTLTAETARATQERLDLILGLSRRTLRASSLLMQADGGAFCEADPKERRQILSEALGLDRFGRYHAAVGADRKETAATTQRLQGMLDALGGHDQAEEALVLARAGVRDTEAKVERLSGEITVDADAARLLADLWERMSGENAHAEQARLALVSARERLERLEDATVQAKQAETEAAQLREQARPLQALADTHDELVQRVRTLQAAVADAERQQADKRRLDEQHARLALRVEALTSQRDEISLLIENTRSQPDATCDRCHQHLRDEARATMLASLDRDLVETTDNLATARMEAERAVSESAAIVLPDLDETRRLLAEAVTLERQAAAAKVDSARLQERAALLRQQAASATSSEHLDEAAAARAIVDQAEAALAALPTHTADEVAQARAEALARRSLLDERTAELGALKASLGGLRERERIAADTLERIVSIGDELSATQLRLERLQSLERAYGPAGIPTLILESTAIPAIEQHANTVLAQLGGQPARWQVELRTQRDTQTGGVSDTLDVVVLTDTGERDYRALSGGERTRVAVALRLGVARLLAHRQGADCQLLALDEPDALDADGKQALVDVLTERAGEYSTVVLISHDQDLRDRFDHVLALDSAAPRQERRAAAGSPA